MSAHTQAIQEIRRNLELRLERDGEKRLTEELQDLQIAAYVAAGGGFVGNFLATCPRNWYVDDRCGRLPYKRRDLYKIAEVLTQYAYVLCLDPYELPAPPVSFHHCGVW